MRIVVLAAICAPLLLPACASSNRQAWCAIHGDGGVTPDCAYVTWEQCRQTVSGGGFCQRNPRRPWPRAGEFRAAG